MTLPTADRVTGGPEMRLATYGTLAPGRPNHGQLSDVPGRWLAGRVRGVLVEAGWGAELGYPGLILDPDAAWIEVFVFESSELLQHWHRLGEFEGPGYRRVAIDVSTAEGLLPASIYVLADPGDLVSIQIVRELRAGLWHWQAPHPEWTPEQRWPQAVSSCAIDDGERLLLFDPLAVPDALLALARERKPVIVLTAPWHERDARALVEQLDATLFAPPPDTAQDLIDKYGITAEEAGDGSPDLAWLQDGGDAVHRYGPGDRLAVGIDAYAGREHNDLVLWVESVRAVVAGDSLVDFGRGLALNEWLRGGVTREQVLERLRPLLGLPVEVVLPAHGGATDRAALARALDAV